jgi:hypothetical protein
MEFIKETLGNTRILGLGVATFTLAIPVVLSALLHVKTEALVPLALALPFATMGVLDAVVNTHTASRS